MSLSNSSLSPSCGLPTVTGGPHRRKGNESPPPPPLSFLFLLPLLNESVETRNCFKTKNVSKPGGTHATATQGQALCLPWLAPFQLHTLPRIRLLYVGLRLDLGFPRLRTRWPLLGFCCKVLHPPSAM
ncbi:hypothetical protein Salat_2506100 [Sesamum alatum]|uniref:Uncharacterized protein n=1 Tax=Sesamum alatum TaxID=300844 RepID=A0AAE1XSJ3_9LAMI|nr:hypothetical protein Salat_2506100 [Sesamum alatum]